MFTRLPTAPFRLAPSRLGLGRAPHGRRLVRRLAGSSLLEALTAPHGVDRYLELVLPGFSLHELRAVIVEVRRRTPGSVTLRLRPNELAPEDLTVRFGLHWGATLPSRLSTRRSTARKPLAAMLDQI